MELTQLNGLNCPYCKGTNTIIEYKEDIEFLTNGTGRFTANCRCVDCDKAFSMAFRFNYQLTNILNNMERT